MAQAPRVCPTCGAGYAGETLFCPKDGAPLAGRKAEPGADPYVGLRVDGRLTLERLVGIGAMGRVYRAHQANLERPVAVKILHPEHARDSVLVARFHREGKVAASIQHPGVVAVLDAGRLPPRAEREGEPYLVMEFLDGLSLRSALVAGSGHVPMARALHVVLQICDAMGQAHSQGIVHRDLKPENVMLVTCAADRDFVKVLDFGVARVGVMDSSIATHAGAVLGTATYACPESARGDRVGPEGDVYSIATLLFECLAGRPPFQGKGPVDVLIQHAQAKPPDVRSFTPAAATPAPIAELIARNLSKNTADRARDARTLGRQLFQALPSSREDRSRSATLLGTPWSSGEDTAHLDAERPSREARQP